MTKLIVTNDRYTIIKSFYKNILTQIDSQLQNTKPISLTLNAFFTDFHSFTKANLYKLRRTINEIKNI